MIKKISFSNFKCLDGQSFDLKKLNVFSGYNGRGKSSVMQYLLMLSQSVRGARDIDKLHLNGDWVSLGDFDEILTDDNKMSLGCCLETDDSQCNTVDLQYKLGDDDIKVGLVEKCVINGVDYFDTMGVLGDAASIDTKRQLKPTPQALLNILNNVHFISANRVGPVKFIEKQEVPETHCVGVNGDFTINTISTYKSLIPIEMNLDRADCQNHSLKELVSLWMSYIMDGGDVNIEGDTKIEGRKSSSVLALEFSSPLKGSSRFFKSYNVGFGYSYILSVVVTALIAKKDSIVIVENPEAHLHPQAQSRMALLLSKLADKGVQVFVETHSEHILNGFRLAALKEDSAITNEDLSIYFFDNNYHIERLVLEPNGRIRNWPKGFFDQSQHDLAEIMRLGAGRK